MTHAKKYSFVDLFSGAGGMSFGFAAHQHFEARFAVDVEVGKPSSGPGSLECNSTYEANIGRAVHSADLSVYRPEELLVDAGIGPGDIDVLISCAPCTGFSRTLNRNHLHDDSRNHLVQRTGAFVETLRPSILVMENARELLRGKFTHHAKSLQRHLLRMDYEFHGSIHKLTAFGLPQVRERAIIIATRRGLRMRTLEQLWDGKGIRPEALKVRRAIESLSPVAAGAIDKSDPMHVSPSFADDLPIRRLEAIPRDGGSWFDMLTAKDAEQLLTPAMKRTAERKDFGSHPDIYGRLWWDRPSVTIKRECSHVGNGRYSHPEQNRLCTVREMALLNGFPSGYTFHGSLSNRYRHVGDAVPPLISHQLAHVCAWILSGEKPILEHCILPKSTLRPQDIVPSSQSLSLFPLTA